MSAPSLEYNKANNFRVCKGIFFNAVSFYDNKRYFEQVILRNFDWNEFEFQRRGTENGRRTMMIFKVLTANGKNREVGDSVPD